MSSRIARYCRTRLHKSRGINTSLTRMLLLLVFIVCINERYEPPSFLYLATNNADRHEFTFQRSSRNARTTDPGSLTREGASEPVRTPVVNTGTIGWRLGVSTVAVVLGGGGGSIESGVFECGCICLVEEPGMFSNFFGRTGVWSF